MKVLSAADAITPAWNHTRALLLKPFRWRGYLKLCFVALVSQLGIYGIIMPIYAAIILAVAVIHFASAHNKPGFLITIIVLAVTLALTVVGFVFLYLGSRMQFVLFEVVATRRTKIGPLWKKFGAKTWRLIGLKLLVGICCAVVVAILLAPIIPSTALLFQGLGHAGNDASTNGPLMASLMLHMFAFQMGVLALELVVGIVISLLDDFALVYLAVEEIGITTCLGRVGGFVKSAPGDIALYMLLKFALLMAMGIVTEIGILIVALISLIPPAIIGVPLYMALHGHGVGATAMLVTAAILGGILFVVWMVLIMVAVMGYIRFWLQGYALYFMGGRYPLLGALLEPPVVPPSEPVAAIG